MNHVTFQNETNSVHLLRFTVLLKEEEDEPASNSGFLSRQASCTLSSQLWSTMNYVYYNLFDYKQGRRAKEFLKVYLCHDTVL